MIESSEADFIELLIASERIEDWLAMLRTNAAAARKHTALLELSKWVQSKETYAEEARRAGAISVLTSLLEQADDSFSEAVAGAIAACTGSLALSGKVTTFTFKQEVIRVQQGRLSDGLGVRIWGLAHALCRELASYPEIVRGLRILEMGSGTGICGLLAAKLGAAEVVLTDCVQLVLANLRACALLNLAPPRAAPPLAAEPGASDLGDPEHADECEAMDRFATPKNAAEDCAAAWAIGQAAIRYLDWDADSCGLASVPSAHQGGAADLRPLPQANHALPQTTHTGPARHSSPEEVNSLEGTVSNGIITAQMGACWPPPLDLDEQYDVLLGSEVIYEMPHARAIAGVIARRLRRGGRCLLAHAVREQAVMDSFFKHAHDQGLRAGACQLDVCEDDSNQGVLGPHPDYEGGFKLISIERADSPASDWHRQGLGL